MTYTTPHVITLAANLYTLGGTLPLDLAGEYFTTPQAAQAACDQATALLVAIYGQNPPQPTQEAA